MMEFEIKVAKPEDKDAFLKLWKEYIQSLSSQGDVGVVSEQNLNFYSTIFDLYTQGQMDGIILLVEDKAVLMWGESPAVIQTKYEKSAQGWGSYVKRKFRNKGINSALMERAQDYLIEQGFDVIFGSYLVGSKNELNLKNFGFKDHTVLIYKEIGKE